MSFTFVLLLLFYVIKYMYIWFNHFNHNHFFLYFFTSFLLNFSGALYSVPSIFFKALFSRVKYLMTFPRIYTYATSLNNYPLASVSTASTSFIFMNLSMALNIPLYVSPDFSSIIIWEFSDTFSMCRGNWGNGIRYDIFRWGLLL